MRKILIILISTVYIVMGIWYLFDFVYTTLFLFEDGIDLGPLIPGAIGLNAGWSMFRYQDFGRKHVIFLLYLRIIINFSMTLGYFFAVDSQGVSTFYFLEKTIYETDNLYIFPVIMCVWILIASIAILFLSQNETKKLFLLEVFEETTNKLGNAIIETKN